MDAGRPLLVLAGGALCLLAALPGARSAEPEPPPLPTLSAASTAATPTGTTSVVPTSLTSDGRPRTFVLHVPDGLLAPAPLVVALHAHSQTADSIRAYTAFEALADEQGFVVAFPSGAGGSWNAGGCCRPGSLVGTDDVAFLDEVIALAQQRADVDADRIAVTGSSNGGMMALRYACERSTTVATAAVVAGPLMAPCAPTDGVSVLVLHGGRDGVVPPGGGRYAPLGVVFPDIGASLEPFRASGSDVDLRVLPEAGHGWMTLDEHGLDATQAVWEWVRDHPRT